MMISTDADNAFAKRDHPLMILEMLSKLVREGIFFDLIKVIYKKNLQLTSHSTRKDLKFFLSQSGTKAKMSALTTPTQHCTEVLASTIREENKPKSCRLEKKT